MEADKDKVTYKEPVLQVDAIGAAQMLDSDTSSSEDLVIGIHNRLPPNKFNCN